ncbi:MAG: hypothetical protein ACXWK1_15220 [Caulobacteraceae bacterium]
MAAKPKAKARPLKVYWAEVDGLHEWIVSAPNRSEALDALGVNQDLFAQGEAGDASDPAAIEAARAQPLTPLRRPRGSSEPFAPATGATDWSAAIPETALKDRLGPSSAKAAKSKAAPPKTPDRRPLDRAEARLAEVEARHRDALKRLAEDRARLDERQAREAADYGQEAAEAKRAVEAAERAFREAGGSATAPPSRR